MHLHDVWAVAPIPDHNICSGAALLRLDIEKYMIEQVIIELFQQMMRTVRVGFIAIGSDMHAVTACTGFRRDRKGYIQAAHTNVVGANVAFAGRGAPCRC